jgi:glycosyltransferase involved in cell wall biosynthesis/SAM-dependent methyltransferase
MPWPRISIVTPSYNQGKFIERTVRSVFLQRYPNLEYILMDGGSTDETLERLQPYRDKFSYFVSERDRGQADAIAKGFARSSGDIMAYLNSDDLLAPDALHFVARFFQENPRVDWIYSHRCTVDDNDQVIWYWILPPHISFLMRRWDYIPQETCFWRRSLFEKTGNIDRSYKFAMDYDLFVRFMNQGNGRRLNRFLGVFRDHSASKTKQLLETVGAREMLKVRRKFRIRAAITDGLFGLFLGNWVKYAGRFFAASARSLPGGFGGIGYDYNDVWGGFLRPETPDRVRTEGNESDEESFYTPICPVSLGLADRLLYKIRSTRSETTQPKVVYLNTRSQVAIISPWSEATDQNGLAAHRLIDRPVSDLTTVDKKANARFLGRPLATLVLKKIGRFPFFCGDNKAAGSHRTADLILEITRGFVSADDEIRFLGVDFASRSPGLLDALKASTNWRLLRSETSSSALAEPISLGSDSGEASLEQNGSASEIVDGVDLIYLGNGIQQSADPRGRLRQAAVLLNPGGWLVLRTPNLDSEQRVLFGSSWAHWEQGKYRFIFSRKSLKELLEQTGFSVARFTTTSDAASSAHSLANWRDSKGDEVENDSGKANEMEVEEVIRVRLPVWDRLGIGDEIFALARRVS